MSEGLLKKLGKFSDFQSEYSSGVASLPALIALTAALHSTRGNPAYGTSKCLSKEIWKLVEPLIPPGKRGGDKR